jgi:predicted nucleic acid-binding protein
MTRIFADSSYWIALLSPDDDLHEKAVLLTHKFASASIFTSEMVLVEVLNSFSNRGQYLRTVAASAVLGIPRVPKMIVLPQTSEHFRSALQLYLRVDDKSWSLTDCASFEIMRAERLSAALTHDRHFAQAGFEVLMA